MLKKVFVAVFVFMFVSSLSLLAQNVSDLDSTSLDDLQGSATTMGEPQFGLELGSSFSSFSGMNPMFTQTVSPFMNYQLHPRLNLSFGATLGRTSGSAPFMSGSATEGMASGLNQSALFAGGTYELNKNITLRGAGWMERGSMVWQTPMNPQAFDMNASGMMMGLDFRINDRFTIGAEVNMSQGNHPFHYQQHRNFPYRRNHPFAP